MKNYLKTNFLFGSATSAYQIEGAWNQDGKGLSNWDEFTSIEGNTYNNTNGKIAADHYNRFEEDVLLMKEQGLQVYRFSIMWSRIFPKGFGEPNLKGINFYTKLIDKLIKHNIEPIITVYHWDEPLDVSKKGTFNTVEGRESFIKFNKKCFELWGDKVSKWIIYNEPLINIFMGYVLQKSPPSLNNPKLGVYVAYQSVITIARVVKEYKKMGFKGMIGFSHPYSPSYPKTKSKEDIKASKLYDDLINGFFLEPLINGSFKTETLDMATKYAGFKPTKEELQIVKQNTINFLGMNYYNHEIVGFPSKEGTSNYNNSGDNKETTIYIPGLFETYIDDNCKKTEWGWNIYPKGLYDSLMIIKEQYKNIPVMITENGIGLKESLDKNNEINDDLRIKFIGDHLLKVNDAINDGADVIGYCSWSFIDLLSWHNGYQKRYGYVYINKDNNNQRIKKKSFYWMKNIIDSRGDILF